LATTGAWLAGIVVRRLQEVGSVRKSLSYCDGRREWLGSVSWRYH